MAEFSVVLADLTSMASSFATAGTQYDALRPQVTPKPADTGDTGLNEQLSGLMTPLAGLQTKMSEAIDEPSTRLATTRDSFARHDIDVRFMFDDLMPEQ